MHIVLASASPRRRELMEMLGAPALRIVPAKGEERPPEGVGPEELVKALSAAKAREIAALSEKDDVIIGADTIVWHRGRVYGKPRSREEAIAMLEALSGETHEVYTGVTVIRGEAELCEAERSLVHFRELSRREIEAYVDSGEPMDKAGAYGAQGKAALFVRGIEGDFFNVMGLPLCRLGTMLRKQGVELL
ncbi:MAG: septum formation protein Maf [Oscillospiraceae bacterium]|nr:septum formation protein Maf [Oscillospiraceae bacterium]